MPAYVLYHDDRSTLWPQTLFANVVQHLQSEGVDLRCEGRASFQTRMWGRVARDASLVDSWAVIQNTRNSQYLVLDCHDWTVPDELPLYMRDPRCVRILKCQYRAPAKRRRRLMRAGPLRDIQGLRRAIVKPWTYVDLHWPAFQDLHVKMRCVPRTEPVMFFRGGLEGFEPDKQKLHPDERDMKNMRMPVIEALDAMGIMNDNHDWIPYEPYINEMALHKIALSLNGDGEFCHRDIEALAIGVPLLRTKLRNQTHETLKENVHYISVDCDAEKDSVENVARKIAERYKEVLGMPDLLASVARNGIEWYERNVCVPNCLNLTAELLQLDF